MVLLGEEEKLIGVLLVSHGSFAKELLKSSQMITGEFKQSDWLSLNEDDSIELFQAKVEEKLSNLDLGEGVLVLADLYGGTPYNRVVSCIKEAKTSICLLAGMNMAMVLTANLERTASVTLEQLVDLVYEEGRNAIMKLNKQESKLVAEDEDGCEEE